MMKRSELETSNSLRETFDDIRHYVAGNSVGITLDSEMVKELIFLLLCKVSDERNTKPNDQVQFQLLEGSNSLETVKSLMSETRKKPLLKSLNFIDKKSGTKLGDKTLSYCVESLQKLELSGSSRDVMGEAFETLIGPFLRGDEGQFFTPRTLIELAVRMVNPKENELILDPACGAGGFLISAMQHISKTNSKYNGKGILGIDKDTFLSEIAQCYLIICGGDKSFIANENSLDVPLNWSKISNASIQLGTIDVIVTNPPFGAKIPVTGEELLKQYELGRKWKKNVDGDFEQTEKLLDKQPPQILFIERCLQFLRPGGRLAIVLPESILGNARERYVRQFTRTEANVVAIVDCPIETFQPGTSTKVGLLILQKKTENSKQEDVWMAISETCGHDRRGKVIYREDGTLDNEFDSIGDLWEQSGRDNYVGF